MSCPQVSILMAVRNEEQFLPAALRSLTRQTCQNWELVAVDDGSTDATAHILAAAARQDSRIRPLRQPPRGLVAALNAGLELCRSPLTARMDGDDIAHTRRLELQIAALQNDPTLTLVASRVRHFPRPSLRNGMLAYEAWQNELLSHRQIIRNLFVESPFAHPSVTYRTEPVRALGGYREMPWAEDYDLWLRLEQNGARFLRLPDTLLYWRDRPDRLTRTAKNCSLAAFRACKSHYLKEGFLAGQSRVTLWGAGLEGKAWRKTLHSHHIEVGRWVEIDPNKIGQTIHDAPVISPEQLCQPGEKVLVTVGAKGARQQIRTWCEQRGLQEGEDYLCVT